MQDFERVREYEFGGGGEVYDVDCEIAFCAGFAGLEAQGEVGGAFVLEDAGAGLGGGGWGREEGELVDCDEGGGEDGADVGWENG